MIANFSIKRGIVILAGSLVFSGWAHAASDELLNYPFKSKSATIEDWGLTGPSAECVSPSPVDDGVVLKTGASNIRLAKGDSGWGNYKVSLSGKVLYPCSFELIGHYNDRPSPSYYFLKIDSAAKQIVLGRFLGLKTETLQQEPLPETFKTGDFELALEFDGTSIKGYLNNVLVCTEADDGRMPAGKVGIVGEYYTNLLLTGITVVADGVSQKSGMTAKPTSPRLEGEAISLSLKNWDLAAAFKKKTDFVKLTL